MGRQAGQQGQQMAPQSQPQNREKLQMGLMALGQSLAGGNGLGYISNEMQDRRRIEQAGADRVRDSYQRQQQMGREDERYADMIARQGQQDARQHAYRVEDDLRRSLADVNQEQSRVNALAEDTRRFELGRSDKLAEMAQKPPVVGPDGLSKPGALQALTDRTLAGIGRNQIEGDLAMTRFAAGAEGLAKPPKASTAAGDGWTDEEWYDARIALMPTPADEEPSKDAVKAEIIRRRLGRIPKPTTPLNLKDFIPAIRGR